MKNNDINDIIKLGIDGIEVYYENQDEEYYHQLAIENNLLITGGSDYHGTVKPNISLMTGINNNLLIKAEYISWLD